MAPAFFLSLFLSQFLSLGKIHFMGREKTNPLLLMSPLVAKRKSQEVSRCFLLHVLEFASAEKEGEQM